jgi:hypothetical protein
MTTNLTQGSEALWQVAFRTFPSGPAVMLAGVCGTANSVMAPAEVTRAMSVARYSVLQRFRSGPVVVSPPASSAVAHAEGERTF